MDSDLPKNRVRNNKTKNTANNNDRKLSISDTISDLSINIKNIINKNSNEKNLTKRNFINRG
jgi:hypothetical protein